MKADFAAEKELTLSEKWKLFLIPALIV